MGITQHLNKARRGETGRKNIVSDKFQKTLVRMERAGVIIREGDGIRILDREGLRAWNRQQRFGCRKNAVLTSTVLLNRSVHSCGWVNVK